MLIKLKPGTAVCALALMLMTPVAPAVDGVIEINQVLAETGGVTAGDMAGFPVTISRSGSYRLTGNLDARGSADPANTRVIHITADNVTLDLNGFSVLGPTTCSGEPPTDPVTCNPAGSAAGTAIHALQNNIRIESGVIDGAAGTGILCGIGCVVERVTVRNSWLDGIGVLKGSTVQASVVISNRSRGIISAGASGLGEGVKVQDNSVFGNGSGGIELIWGLVTGNSIGNNGQHGLTGSLGTAYGGNVLIDNNGGSSNPQVVSGTQIGTNFCGTNTTCP